MQHQVILGKSVAPEFPGLIERNPVTHSSPKYLQLIETAHILRGLLSFLHALHQVGWVTLELFYQLFFYSFLKWPLAISGIIVWRGLGQLRTGTLNFKIRKVMPVFDRMDRRTVTWPTDVFMPPEDLGKELRIFWDQKNNAAKESSRQRSSIKWRVKTFLG